MLSTLNGKGEVVEYSPVVTADIRKWGAAVKIKHLKCGSGFEIG